MAKTVVGLMSSEQEAEALVRNLTQQCGCERADISLLGEGALRGAGTGPIDALTKTGMPEEEAHWYAEGVRRGGTLVTVHARSDQVAQCAASVMDGGAVRLAENEKEVVQVAEEELLVGKREVNKGGVRVYTRVSEKPVQETVQLREERAHVERRPVDRPVAAGDDAFKEQIIEVRETAEEPVVSKRARVVEEVVVSKEQTEREETVQDTVRQTDVRVEEARPTQRNYGGVERRKAFGNYGGSERRARAATH